MSDPIRVTIYSRADCHLCAEARRVIDASVRRLSLPVVVQEVDIDSDRELSRRYGIDVPVIAIDGEEAFQHSVDEEAFASAVRARVGRKRTAAGTNRSQKPGSTATGMAAESCVPCRGGVPPLTEEEIKQPLEELGNGWKVEAGHHLMKEYTFPDFLSALAFTNRVGEIAEREGHHPDIALSWGRVGIKTWTHKIDGLTRSDFILAAKIEQLR
jgi:4a-hydroxytetrahydrobiopterin dehydratase